MSAILEEQIAQMEYWLDFLNSSLPLPPGESKYSANSKWVIIPVGLKADKVCLKEQKYKKKI